MKTLRLGAAVLIAAALVVTGCGGGPAAPPPAAPADDAPVQPMPMQEEPMQEPESEDPEPEPEDPPAPGPGDGPSGPGGGPAPPTDPPRAPDPPSTPPADPPPADPPPADPPPADPPADGPPPLPPPPPTPHVTLTAVSPASVTEGESIAVTLRVRDLVDSVVVAEVWIVDSHRDDAHSWQTYLIERGADGALRYHFSHNGDAGCAEGLVTEAGPMLGCLPPEYQIEWTIPPAAFDDWEELGPGRTVRFFIDDPAHHDSWTESGSATVQVARQP